jgi:hypothetical protein
LLVPVADLSTPDPADPGAAAEPDPANTIHTDAGELLQRRRRAQLLGAEERAPVPCLVRESQLPQLILFDNQYPVRRQHGEAQSRIDAQAVPFGSDGPEESALPQVQIICGAHPQATRGILHSTVYDGAGYPLVLSEALEIRSVMAKQAILGAHPYEAFVILQQAGDAQIRQSVLLAVVAKRELLRARPPCCNQ